MQPYASAFRDRGRAQHLSEDQVRDLYNEPVVAYSICYPLGVIGVLLCFQIVRRFWFRDFQPIQEQPEIHVRDSAVRNGGVAGRTVSELMHANAQESRIRNQPHPEPKKNAADRWAKK
ncbi:MAG TPA: hypothetical protein VEH47_06960 [Candidatus Acidoferrales bacterium]|nr:hypothetical protein [Candidatus Acidoferrales bacterium]